MTKTSLPETGERLMKVAEAAAALGLSEKFIRRAIETGDLAHHRFGRAIRISSADLERFKTRNRH